MRNAANNAALSSTVSATNAISTDNSSSYLTPTATSTTPRYVPPVLHTQSTTTATSPTEPAQPNLIEQAFTSAKNWLFGGNTVVRVGVVLLFIGLAFLAKYTVQLGLFPIEAGLALLIIGFLVRRFCSRQGRVITSGCLLITPF